MAQRAPRKLTFVPSRYPTRTVDVAAGIFDIHLGCHTEGTRVLITENMSTEDGHQIAVNGDTGIVESLLHTPGKNGVAKFTNADRAAFTVRLDRTSDTITVYAHQIELKDGCPGQEEDESAWLLDGPPTKKRKKHKIWVVDVTEGYAGTIHTQQGRTIVDETLVVNWDNMSTEALFVALSRVKSVRQLRFDAFSSDPDLIKRLMRKPPQTRWKREFLELISMADTYVEKGKARRMQASRTQHQKKERQRGCLGY